MLAAIALSVTALTLLSLAGRKARTTTPVDFFGLMNDAKVANENGDLEAFLDAITIARDAIACEVDTCEPAVPGEIPAGLNIMYQNIVSAPDNVTLEAMLQTATQLYSQGFDYEADVVLEVAEKEF